MTVRNPPWSRDELILALDLYFQYDEKHFDDTDPKVKELSKILNNLPSNKQYSNLPKFRSHNAVAMKLQNIRSIDPNNKSEGKGLSNGGHREKQVWEEFSNDINALHKYAEIIIKSIDISEKKDEVDEAYEDGFPEGKTIERKHKSYERNTKAIKAAKEKALKSGKLHCEICEFDFYKTYGELGAGFIECHHILPLYEYNENRITKIDDLVLVCSNCHRMLHKKRPWENAVNELKVIVKNQIYK